MKKSTGIPVLIIAALLPLTVYFHMESIGFSQYPWFPNQGYWFDWFLFGKGQLLLLMAVLMISTMIGLKIKKRKISTLRDTWLLIIAGIFMLISAVTSKYPEQSFSGSIEQYESIGVLVAYLILLFFTSAYTAEGKHIELVEKALLAGFAVSCVLGVLQLAQADFFSSEMGKRLLVPASLEELRDGLRFSKDAKGFGRVYMALYNSSYAGIYIAMILPFLALSEKRYIKWLTVPAILCLMGTMSKTAWAAALMVAVLGMLMMKKQQKWRISLIAVGIIGILIAFLPAEDGVISGEKELQEVTGEAEHIRIVYQGNELYFSEYPKDGGVKYKLTDQRGEKIPLTWSEERGELDPIPPEYEGLHFKVYVKEEISYAVFRYEDVIFRFTDDLGTGKYEYISINGKPDELADATVLMKAGDTLLNGRGYIWNRVLPIVKEHLLFGTGPDTFLQVFPQDDYVARANLGYGFFSEILTNAHSLYLQTTMQTGVVVFGSLCFFLYRYLKKAWKTYAHKETYDKRDKVGIACFLGSAAYLICGLTFSSSICTTPIFIILVGTGIGILTKSEKE